MTILFNAIYLVCISLWVGGITLFSFIVTPILADFLKSISDTLFGEVTIRLFPAYYRFGIGCGVVALVGLIASGMTQRSFPWLRIALVGLMLGCTLYAAFVIRPRMHETRQVKQSLEDGLKKDQKQKEFEALHLQSVLLNGATLLTGLVALVLTAKKID